MCYSLAIVALLVSCFGFNTLKTSNSIYAEYNIDWDEGDERTAQRSYTLTLFERGLRKLVGDSYDDIYAGQWLGFETGPYVGLTSIDNNIQELAKKYGVILVEQKYTYKELLELQEKIVEENETKYDKRHVQSAIMFETNTLELTLFRVEELRLKNPEVVEALEKDDRITLFDMLEEETEGGYYASVKGGEKITVGNANLPCSVGFAAKSGSSTGFVTAGHCGDTSALQKSVKFNGTVIGTIEKHQLSGKLDAAWVKLGSGHSVVKNTFANNSPYAAVSSSTQSGVNVNSQIKIYGTPHNSTSGKTSTCTIKSINATRSWDGKTFTDLISTDCKSSSFVQGMSGGVAITGYHSTTGGSAFSAAGIFTMAFTDFSYVIKSTNIMNVSV